MLVFVPIASEDLGRLIAGEAVPGPLPAYAPSREVGAALGFPSDWGEETERACLLFASVAALAAHGRRLVAVADVVRATPGADADSGEVSIPALRPESISAFFSDGPDAPTAAAAVANGLGLDEAWDLPEVAELVSEHDLLWFGASEASVLLERN